MFFKIHGKYTENTRKIHGKNTENTRKFAQHRIGHELGTNWARSVANLLQWDLTIMTLFHTNSTKNVKKSQNQDIIPYKFYQKCHEISKAWRYSVQILTKTPWNLTILTLFHTSSTKNVKKSQIQDIIPFKFYQKCHEILWSHTTMTLFQTNSTKKCHEI